MSGIRRTTVVPSGEGAYVDAETVCGEEEEVEMTISRSTAVMNLLMAFLVCLVVLCILRLSFCIGESAVRNARRDASFALGAEMMESSRMLTQQVRTFAVTGNPEHERKYHAVVDERAGKIPRSQDKQVAPGRKVPLADLLKEQGATA